MTAQKNKDIRDLDALKDAYMHAPIPPDLELKVRRILKKKRLKAPRIAAGVAGLFLVFVLTLNTNQSFANALAEIPGIGGIVRILAFRFPAVETETAMLTVEVPEIQGLEDEALQRVLNAYYLEEGEEVYARFNDALEAGRRHFSVDSGFSVLRNDGRLIVIERRLTETMASGTETVAYDVIDKQTGKAVALSELFADNRYVQVISEYIRAEMMRQMEEDDQLNYWIGDAAGDIEKGFVAIAADQTFYIDADSRLVIVFNPYEVAPGAMGVLRFTVPTSALQGLLSEGSVLRP